jgi:hypothetical protein
MYHLFAAVTEHEALPVLSFLQRAKNWFRKIGMKKKLPMKVPVAGMNNEISDI